MRITQLLVFQAYDATVLAASYSGPQLDILIDQGRDDQFLSASQLLPDNLIAVCSEKKIPVVFRLQPVSSFAPFKVKAQILQLNLGETLMWTFGMNCLKMSAH